jgi:hypothetical protein
MENKCVFCGKTFQNKRKVKVKYCSQNCITKQWRKLNPDKYKEQHRNRQKLYIRKETPESLERRRTKQAEYGHTTKGRFNCYKSAAKVRSLSFNLTFEQFMTFWQKPCFYCGNAIEKIGIDRVDTKNGYSMDDCVSCCSICNRMKMDHSVEKFLEHCRRILSFMDKKPLLSRRNTWETKPN